jgi:hypothetical protein
VVRSEIADAMAAHVRAAWPAAVEVAFVNQDEDRLARRAAAAGRRKPLGTAHAVACASPMVDGPFAVVNADDLYGSRAFASLARTLERAPGGALVTFAMANTLLGPETVKRALCTVADARLVDLEEGSVGGPDEAGVRVWTGAATGRAVTLRGDEPVSMNMWGFQAPAMEAMREAAEAFVGTGAVAGDGEVLLPDVVSALMHGPDRVPFAAVASSDKCLGITHAADLAAVRKLCAEPAW